MNQPEVQLKPLPYHTELRDYLKSREPELWNWFASSQAKADYIQNLRQELLKSAYRLDAGDYPELHQGLDKARQQLQLDIPVTLYQAQNNPQTNASLFFIPGESHIVFSGNLLTLLDPAEIEAVLGHELAHYHLLCCDQGEYHLTERLIQAVSSDTAATSSHVETARRFQLYTEIFADRGSLAVSGDMAPVVSGLVKLQTGLAQVNARSYLKQAEEIFKDGNVPTGELTHPEAFIRVRALSLWQSEQDVALDRIRPMIEGGSTLDELDLIGQSQLTRTTRRFLERLLQPKWFRTEPVLSHARMFFNDFDLDSVSEPAPLDTFKTPEPSLRDYWCYLLLDFASVDPDLNQLPLAAALDLSRQLEMDERFESIATRDLKLKKRELQKLKEAAAEMLAQAEAAS